MTDQKTVETEFTSAADELASLLCSRNWMLTRRSGIAFEYPDEGPRLVRPTEAVVTQHGISILVGNGFGFLMYSHYECVQAMPARKETVGMRCGSAERTTLARETIIVRVTAPSGKTWVDQYVPA